MQNGFIGDFTDIIAEAFLATDGILDLYINVTSGLVVYPKVTGIGNALGRQLRMAWQFRLFQMSGHRYDIDRVCMSVADIIGNDDNRTDAALHAGIRMTAEVCEPNLAALRSMLRRTANSVMHRHRDIFSRIKTETSVIFCFQAFVLTSHFFTSKMCGVTELSPLCRLFSADHTEGMIL